MQVLHCSDITQYWYTWLSFRLPSVDPFKAHLKSIFKQFPYQKHICKAANKQDEFQTLAN